jgi:hypothetical protein
MRLYKYRDLSDTAESSIQRLSKILRENAFWSARPSTLNDDFEFIWDCNYEPTSYTIPLLTNLLVKLNGRTAVEAQITAQNAVFNHHVESIARPVFENMIIQCRQEYGLLCFGTSNDNKVMWERYAGNGNGVCIEITVPDKLLNEQLFPVEYPLVKMLHIDQLLDTTQIKAVRGVALLSKTISWASEKEIRYVSTQQDINIRISGSVISNIVLGPNLTHKMRRELKVLIESLPYHLPMSV